MSVVHTQRQCPSLSKHTQTQQKNGELPIHYVCNWGVVGPQEKEDVVAHKEYYYYYKNGSVMYKEPVVVKGKGEKIRTGGHAGEASNQVGQQQTREAPSKMFGLYSSSGFYTHHDPMKASI